MLVLAPSWRRSPSPTSIDAIFAFPTQLKHAGPHGVIAYLSGHWSSRPRCRRMSQVMGSLDLLVPSTLKRTLRSRSTCTKPRFKPHPRRSTRFAPPGLIEARLAAARDANPSGCWPSMSHECAIRSTLAPTRVLLFEGTDPEFRLRPFPNAVSSFANGTDVATRRRDAAQRRGGPCLETSRSFEMRSRAA
jgi:hypothetical protein